MGGAAADTGVVPVDGGEIWYASVGEGPPVVLLHGSPATSDVWAEEARRLAPRFRTLRCDLRGHGRSASTSIEFRFDEDLGTVLDRLGIARAHLVGHSVGGVIALDFAVENPARVASLALVAPGLPGFESPEPAHRALRTRWSRIVEDAEQSGDPEATLDAMLAAWLAGPYRTVDALDPTVVARAREILRGGLEGSRLGDLRAVGPEPPTIDRLGRLRLPLITILGTLDFPHFTEIADRIGHDVRGAERARVEGTGHFPMIERPEEFHAVLAAFLERVRSRAA